MWKVAAVVKNILANVDSIFIKTVAAHVASDISTDHRRRKQYRTNNHDCYIHKQKETETFIL